jgi:photosystem II stability/assembly factor-like uncharacterized protein
MAQRTCICVGAVGQGIWHSPDGGEHWSRMTHGISFETEVRAFAVHPQRPEVLFAGTDRGLYRSKDAGASWTWIESPLDAFHVWALAINADDPRVMFAGTRPGAVFRSTDGGQRWRQLSVDIAKECPAVGIPRITQLVIDPTAPQTIWAGIEVDGIRRSSDGGETWQAVHQGLTNLDVHGMAVSAGATKTVWATTNNEVFMSADDGSNWQPIDARQLFPHVYCRGILVQPHHPDTVFIGVGDYTPGSTGVIERTRDGGQTWETHALPVEPNTAMWCLGAHPADPNLIFACSLYGYLYRSSDGGDSWMKLRREFSEVRAIAWIPA